MGKRAYINDGNDNWIPLVSSLPNLDAYATKDYVDINLLDYATQQDLEDINISSYLTINSASSTYLTQANASANYALLSDYNFPIKQNLQTISSNYTFLNGYNGISGGPVSIENGVTVTVTSGSTWSIA